MASAFMVPRYNNIPIIIVTYRNPKDVVECLEALSGLVSEPKFDIYLCENGGKSSFDALVSALAGGDGPCKFADCAEPIEKAPHFLRTQTLNLRGKDVRVFLAEADENLGYAGAINAWLRILMMESAWPGVWVLNPDTQPTSHALSELVAWSKLRGKGMVGSRIVTSSRPDLIHSRGLRWRRLHSSTEAVDYLTPAVIEPEPAVVESRIDAPSGASIYVTRDCLNEIGLMDERYFLYFEDLDWGYRAKKRCGVGYAYNSVVLHHVGTTIGTARRDKIGSDLSIYLEFRNRIHFVRRHHRAWLPWTLAVLSARSFEYAARGAFGKTRAAIRGLLAGVTGEVGRPDHMANASS